VQVQILALPTTDKIILWGDGGTVDALGVTSVGCEIGFKLNLFNPN
jgi:hypothetical protein